jgi:hypothetical protein
MAEKTNINREVTADRLIALRHLTTSVLEELGVEIGDSVDLSDVDHIKQRGYEALAVRQLGDEQNEFFPRGSLTQIELLGATGMTTEITLFDRHFIEAPHTIVFKKHIHKEGEYGEELMYQTLDAIPASTVEVVEGVLKAAA